MECIRVLTKNLALVKALLPELLNWFRLTLDNSLEMTCVAPHISKRPNSLLS